MSELDDIRQHYPQYQDWNDRELADALKDKYYPDMSDEEYYPQLGLDPSPGWKGVGGDFIEGVKDLRHIPAALKHVAQQANPQLEGLDNMSGKRMLQNLGAGLGEMGRSLLSVPGNIVDYGHKKEIIPDWVSAWRPSEEMQNFDYKQGVGLGEEQPGDALVQALPELIGYGAAGEAGQAGKLLRTAQRAASFGTQAIAHNQNPVTAALAVPATELGIKGIGMAGGLAAKGIGKVLGGPAKSLVDFGKRHLAGSEGIIANDVMGDILPSEMSDAISASQAGKRLGVTLTPAEAAGSPLLAKTEGSLGTTKQGRKDYSAFKKGQKAQQAKAVGGLLDDVSPTKGVAGEEVRTAAKSVIEKERQAMLVKAEPYYKAAETETLNPNTLNNILKDSNVSRAWDEVLKDPLYATEIEAYSPNSIKVLDLTKRRLDAQIAQKQNFGDMDAVRILTEAKNKLVSQLDKASPNYAQGRKLYAGDAEVLEKLQQSNVGKISNISDAKLKDVSKIIFDPQQTDISVLNKLRDTFVKENPEAWQKIIRNEMERRLDTKGVNKTSNSGSNFYDKILSNDRDFNQFMNALDGNPVAQQKLTDMRLAFKNLINSYTVKTAAGQAKSSLDVPRSSFQWAKQQIDDFLGGKYDKKAIEIITDPNWDVKHLPKINSKSTPAAKVEYLKSFSEIINQASKRTAPQAIANDKDKESKK